MTGQEVLTRLMLHKTLTQKEAEALLKEMMHASFSPVLAGAILTALTMKGEETSEIVGFISAMRRQMKKIVAEGAVDVCGTGGDGKNTFNISTTVGIVVAACGVPMVKHGNRAASSKTGSADVLEALGVTIMLTPEQAEDVFKKVGFVFLFAPLFHPSMKSVADVRKELKIRTIFNILGPFANPASVTKQLIGVPNSEIAEKMIKAGESLGYERLVIVTSNDGLDEVSIVGTTECYLLIKGKVTHMVLDPKAYGFFYTESDGITGDGPQENAAIIKNVLSGKKGQARDIVLLNSAVAFLAAGEVKEIAEGISMAEEAIDSGRAMEMLKHLRKETNYYA